MSSNLHFQMLYYVADPRATVSFFRSLLNENGKLMIILVSGNVFILLKKFKIYSTAQKLCATIRFVVFSKVVMTIHICFSVSLLRYNQKIQEIYTQY